MNTVNDFPSKALLYYRYVSIVYGFLLALKYFYSMVSCIAILLVLVPQIILLGAPATGKATIAKMICSKLRAANLSPASLIEESESHLKNAVLEYQNKNQVRMQCLSIRIRIR